MDMTQATLKSDESTLPPFEQHLRIAVGDVRAAILEIMASAGADPNRPQEVARQFGLRTGLTWKVCKVVQEADLYSAVPHVPGATGLKLFVDAFERAGADAGSVKAARSASRAFEKMVEIHTGDRQTLLTMLGHLAPVEQQARREADRKLAFQGNSANWGVQARLNLSMQFVAPNPDAPEMIDLVTTTGLYDFRRLRRGARWVLLRSISYNDDGTLRPDNQVPVDPSSSPEEGLRLMKDFCSGVPEIHEAPLRNGTQYELSDGPVGHSAAFTCVFGTFTRQFACWHRDELNQFGEHPTLLFTPSELLIGDVFIHRDLPFELPPEAALYSGLFDGVDAAWSGRESDRMALAETVLDLGSPPIIATPQIPRYPQMVQAVCDRLDWSVKDFRAYRLMMKYPPIPTVLVLRYPLPE